MPGTLNKYDAAHVEYFALRPLVISGVSFAKGAIIPGAKDMKNIENLVRSRRVVPVVGNRNLLPKMFLRELRTPEYVKAKYGFYPNMGTTGNDYDPRHKTPAQVVAFVTAEPSQKARVIAAESAGKNRASLITQLNALP